MAEPVTLINSFEVPGDDAERFIAEWEKTRDYVQSAAGMVAYRPHASLYRVVRT